MAENDNLRFLVAYAAESCYNKLSLCTNMQVKTICFRR